MSKVILKRLGIGIFVLLGAVSIMFVLLRIAPGGPALLILGPEASLEEIAILEESMGLNASFIEQYFSYIGQVLRLDFGMSYRFGMPAMDVIATRLLPTIKLTLAATLVATVVGILLGVLAGKRPGSITDRVVSTISILFQSMPTFWVGIMLVLFLALKAGILPSSGDGTIKHLILPAVTLSMPFIAIVARITRTSLAEAMSEAYIQTARSKGLSEAQVVRGHALRNSLVPVVTIIGLQVGQLIGGAVVVENVFAWPGLGSLIVQSVSYRDYAAVQAAVIVIALFVVVLNLVADLLYSVLDPRIRTEGEG